MPLEADVSAASDENRARGADWWRQPFSVFQTNLQEVDATMDVEAVLDRIENQGATTWLINTGGIVSFYPSDLDYQTRNPYLVDRASGDLIGDAVKAAHARGIRVISRLDFSKVSSRIAHEHPEWLFVSPTGKPQIYNTLYSTCPCADYYQHRSLDILDEIIDRYPVDGFFFNWFGFSEKDYSRVNHGVCHCNHCQKNFSEYSGGKELPDGAGHPNYPEWLEFSEGVIVTLCEKIAKHITSRKADAALALKRGAPIVYYEANNAFGRDPWHHNTSENVSAHMTGLPETSVVVNSVSFVDMPYRMSGEQPEMFAQYLIQAIARGGNPSTYIMGAPGRIPYANLPLAGKIQNFHRENKEVYDSIGPTSAIALVRQSPVKRANPGYNRSVSEFRGLFSGLKERHLPFDVISAEYIEKIADEGRLAQFDLIILPDLGSIGSAASSALDAFVRAGGNVVLTGCSAISDEGECEMATGPCIMRTGPTLTDEGLWSSYVTDAEQSDADSFTFAPTVIPVYGAYSDFVWKPRAEKLGRFVPQAPFGPPEKCYGHILSDRPAAVRMSSGGTVTQYPWTIGHTYREFGTTEVRDYFLDSIASLAAPEVRADLPEQVELIAGRSTAGLVLHVINQTGARSRSFGPHVPVPGGTLRIRGHKGPARLVVSDQELAGRIEGEDLILDMPELGLYEVVVLSEESA